MGDLIYLPLKIFLIAIDLLITILTFGWIGAVKKLFEGPKARSVPVADDESHRVDPRFRGNLAKVPGPGLETLCDIAEDAIARYGPRKCMASRQFLGYKTPKIKKFGPDIVWRTYDEVGAAAYKFGAALRAAGMSPAPPTTDLDKVKTPCRLAIFENTCPEWMIASLGAFTQSVTVTTVYATLGMDAVVEAVVDNIVPVMVCNKKHVSKLVDMIKKMPTLKTIIYTNDTIAPGEEVDMPSAPRGVTIISFEEFVASGDTSKYPSTKPTPDTCAVVMYTSGSTGKPKGVIIKHSQIVATVAAAEHALHVRKGKETYLAYLPLAHIMELMAEYCFFASGCALCYADPRTLSATGSSPIGALEAYKPTMMVAVPKIWDTIKKGVLAKVAKTAPAAQFLVHTALQWRGFALKCGFDTPLFNVLVFKKLKAAVGGNLVRAISGGGPLNGEVQEFIRTAFGIYLNQGYGLTETNAALSFQDTDDLRTGIAGQPVPSVEVKVESTPDIRDKGGLPYLSSDRVDVDGNPIFGRGEICVRGPSVSCGYYMMKDKTAEDHDSDGWFHTGDIGQFESDGSIRIVDRKKNLVKLKGGEYIAVEKMEMTYGNSSFVDAVHGGICCYGDGDMDRPVALMQLNEPVTMKWAEENGVQGDFDSVMHSKELYGAIMEDMKSEHAKSDLSHLEKLIAVALVHSPWTPENGCLTAANKLDRRQVVAQFEKEFEEVKEKGVFD